MIDRRTAREIVLQALYAEEVSENKPDHVLQLIVKKKLKDDRNALKFGERLFLKTYRFQEELDDIIQRHIKNWKLDRLATVDRQIIRMALTEFLYFDDIPTKVTINEAIEVAKRFSTNKSGNFVNGILDAALDELNEQGRIQKTGRGLIDSSIESS